jgi:hypothetical protein
VLAHARLTTDGVDVCGADEAVERLGGKTPTTMVERP